MRFPLVTLICAGVTRVYTLTHHALSGLRTTLYGFMDMVWLSVGGRLLSYILHGYSAAFTARSASQVLLTVTTVSVTTTHESPETTFEFCVYIYM